MRGVRGLALVPVMISGLLLGGCSLFQETDNSVEGVCARQADNDPQVHQLMMLRLSSNGLSQQLEGPYNSARRQAIQSCLYGHGAAPPGGVAPVQTNRY